MAIHIFGESKAPTQKLPFPEVDLPPPASAPAARRVLDGPRIAELMKHEDETVREFALRVFLSTPDLGEDALLIPLIDDPAPSIAKLALDALGERGHSAAVDAIARRFVESDEEIAGAAAAALSRLDLGRLLETVKTRARLDDTAYSALVVSLAHTNHADAHAFLGRAMDRAGTAGPTRRVTLYTAALISGSTALVQRVLHSAISESRVTGQDEKASPARAAVLAAAGLPIPMSALEAGEELLGQLAPEEDEQVDEDTLRRFVAACRNRAPAEAIRALAPLAEHGVPAGAKPEVRSAVERCRTLLLALLEDAALIEALEPRAGAVFAAAALDSAGIVHAVHAESLTHPSVLSIAKNLECEPAPLASESVAELAARFQPVPPRVIRAVASILANQPVDGDALMDRLVEGLLLAEHGTALLDAAAEAKDRGLALSLQRVVKRNAAIAEAVVLEALERRPLEPKPASVALDLAGALGTERLGLAIGRRFLDLRAVDRFRTANACLRIGDPRLIPLVKARAFPFEPEEQAWVVLSRMAGLPFEGALAEAANRIPRGDEWDEGDLRLPLQCASCDETLSYGFSRVFIDQTAKAGNGDPAFVGDVICKACGADDTLAVTERGSQILMEEMVGFLQAAQAGEQAVPRVIPGSVRFAGKTMGHAAAYREAQAEVAANPDGIRARLRRGRIALTLQRSIALADANAVLERVPDSPEALYIRAAARAQQKDLPAAIEDIAAALRLLDGEPRLFDEDADAIRFQAEASLVQLEAAGHKIPADIDVSNTRATLERLAEERAKASEEAETTARNAPCPCGSGKKYKHCHGR